ncbi:MAG TPA: EfeM/EfeO family lipoprotein [Solirubrobacterales bacterium]|nr:EfeM/EfeO family lipoprotein [Solirubrobacterales bacterium]
MGLTAFLVGCADENEEPSAETRRQLEKSLARYETYLQRNAGKLLHWTETIVLKVGEGSVPKAQSRYAASRIPYGRIDPVADLRVELAAYREIEEGIFGEESAVGLAPVAKGLRGDVGDLRKQIAAADYSPPEVTAGASAVLEEVLESGLPGESEPDSGTTLTTVAAQTEGVDAALEAVEPLLAEIDPDLLARIDVQLDQVYETVGEYGTFAKEPEQSRPQEPGIAFVVYSELDSEAIRGIAQPIENLAKLITQAQPEIESSV